MISILQLCYVSAEFHALQPTKLHMQRTICQDQQTQNHQHTKNSTPQPKDPALPMGGTAKTMQCITKSALQKQKQ
jgi:hypothetical protein